MKLLTALSVCVLFALCPFVSAQDLPTYDELVQRAEEKLGDVDAWSADTVTKMNMMGMPMVFEGKTIASGKKSVNEMTMNMMGQEVKMKTITGDDGIAWSDVEAMGQRQIMKMDLNKMAADQVPGGGMMGIMPGDDIVQEPSEMLASHGETFDLEVVREAEQGGEKVYIVEGTTKEGAEIDTSALGGMMGGADPAMLESMGVKMDSMRLAVDAETGFVRSMSFGEVNGQPFMTMEYNNINLDPEIEEGAFDYTPPEGVPVMDMAAMAEAGVFDEPEMPFSVGEPAPEFEGTAFDGSTVKLSDYRGKVVLVDFWATWCAPCIQELPNVIAAYEAYKDKGFDIVAVSLDDEREALERFMKEHPKMTWTQIYDGKGWESAIAEQYGVQAIPFTLLLDRDGTIVAMDLRGEALAAEVEKLVAE